MEGILETLRDDHRIIGRLLDELEVQIDILAHGGAPNGETLRGIAEYFLDYPDRRHHPTEDIIYARLRERYPREAASIGDLADEHRAMAERARRLRDTVYSFLNDPDIAPDSIVNAARIFIEMERRHMTAEERRFFPLAETKLDPEDWSRIAEACARQHDSLFGDASESEFECLRERLLARRSGR